MQDRIFTRRIVAQFCLSAALLASAATVYGRQAAQPPGGSGGSKKQTTTAAAAAKKETWSVKMSKAAPYTFTIKAKDTPLSTITGEISKLVKTPVSLSPLMAQQRVTLDFGGMNLEGTLRMLAPQPYVDYVAGGTDPDQPKPLAIYLHGMNERPPALTATVRGSSEAILIEGDTEDGVGDEEERKRREEAEPLKVSFGQNQLSVRAKKQPLTVVLYRIASEIGVPFELRYESPEVIDVEFTNYTLDQAVRSLSPHVRLYYRIDLQTFQTQPLRLALISPHSLKS
jgi:hypothetical protein